MAAALQSFKKGKSSVVYNIPADLVQAGGENVIATLKTFCNKISNSEIHGAEDHSERIEATSGEDHP